MLPDLEIREIKSVAKYCWFTVCISLPGMWMYYEALELNNPTWSQIMAICDSIKLTFATH